MAPFGIVDALVHGTLTRYQLPWYLTVHAQLARGSSQTVALCHECIF